MTEILTEILITDFTKMPGSIEVQVPQKGQIVELYQGESVMGFMHDAPRLVVLAPADAELETRIYDIYYPGQPIEPIEGYRRRFVGSFKAFCQLYVFERYRY